MATGLANGVMANTVKLLTNVHAVAGIPQLKDNDEPTLIKGSFRELLANMSNKFLPVLMRSNKQSMNAKYLRTVTNDERSTLTVSLCRRP